MSRDLDHHDLREQHPESMRMLEHALAKCGWSFLLISLDQDTGEGLAMLERDDGLQLEINALADGRVRVWAGSRLVSFRGDFAQGFTVAGRMVAELADAGAPEARNAARMMASMGRRTRPGRSVAGEPLTQEWIERCESWACRGVGGTASSREGVI